MFPAQVCGAGQVGQTGGTGTTGQGRGGGGGWWWRRVDRGRAEEAASRQARFAAPAPHADIPSGSIATCGRRTCAPAPSFLAAADATVTSAVACSKRSVCDSRCLSSARRRAALAAAAAAWAGAPSESLKELCSGVDWRLLAASGCIEWPMALRAAQRGAPSASAWAPQGGVRAHELATTAPGPAHGPLRPPCPRTRPAHAVRRAPGRAQQQQQADNISRRGDRNGWRQHPRRQQ